MCHGSTMPHTVSQHKFCAAMRVKINSFGVKPPIASLPVMRTTVKSLISPLEPCWRPADRPNPTRPTFPDSAAVTPEPEPPLPYSSSSSSF